MDIVVDHHLLARALDFYEELGYTRVELPWSVPAWAMQLTNPSLAGMARMGSQYLVASGEQAFLFCDGIDRLPSGKYAALTPCFRPGDDTREYHQEIFYKVELYRTDDISPESVLEVVNDALSFMLSEFKVTKHNLVIKPTPEEDRTLTSNNLITSYSHDINLNGIEVGSYGLRQNQGYTWVYGTGVAEPRFSQAKYHKQEKPTMNDEQIKNLFQRFLGWRLPENFNPDAGISFKREFNENTDWPMKHEPTGTNLFDYYQAEAMIRYLIIDLPQKDNL